MNAISSLYKYLDTISGKDQQILKEVQEYAKETINGIEGEMKSQLLFSDRLWIRDEYYLHLEMTAKQQGIHIKDCADSLLAYLQSKKYLNEEKILLDIGNEIKADSSEGTVIQSDGDA